jgi:hypothetical protein
MNHVAPVGGIGSYRLLDTSQIWQDSVRRSLAFTGILFRSDDVDQEQHQTLSDNEWVSQG